MLTPEKQKLVESCMPMARMFAIRRIGKGYDVGMMISAAYFVLVQAADRFDVTQGTKFSTYAFHAMKVSMMARYDDGPVRKSQFHRVTDAKRQRLANQRSHIEGRQVKVYDLTGQQILLRTTFTRELKDHVFAEHRLRDDEPIDLSCLTARERWFIVEIFMNERQTRDVAAELGITHQRVSQIVAKGIDKLRRHYSACRALGKVPISHGRLNCPSKQTAKRQERAA